MQKTVLITALKNEDEEWDRLDALDVHYPEFDALPGETAVAFNLHYVFTCAGYRVISVEEVKTHPVIVVRAAHKDAKSIVDPRLIFDQIRHLLRSGGFRLQQDQLTVCQTGSRVLVAFQSGAPSADIQKILREPHDELANDGDM